MAHLTITTTRYQGLGWLSSFWTSSGTSSSISSCPLFSSCALFSCSSLAAASSRQSIRFLACRSALASRWFITSSRTSWNSSRISSLARTLQESLSAFSRFSSASLPLTTACALSYFSLNSVANLSRMSPRCLCSSLARTGIASSSFDIFFRKCRYSFISLQQNSLKHQVWIYTDYCSFYSNVARRVSHYRQRVSSATNCPCCPGSAGRNQSELLIFCARLSLMREYSSRQCATCPLREEISLASIMFCVQNTDSVSFSPSISFYSFCDRLRCSPSSKLNSSRCRSRSMISFFQFISLFLSTISSFISESMRSLCCCSRRRAEWVWLSWVCWWVRVARAAAWSRESTRWCSAATLLWVLRIKFWAVRPSMPSSSSLTSSCTVAGCSALLSERSCQKVPSRQRLALRYLADRSMYSFFFTKLLWMRDCSFSSLRSLTLFCSSQQDSWACLLSRARYYRRMSCFSSRSVSTLRWRSQFSPTMFRSDSQSYTFFYSYLALRFVSRSVSNSAHLVYHSCMLFFRDSLSFSKAEIVCVWFCIECSIVCICCCDF